MSSGDRGRLAWLMGGAVALVAGTLLGWNGTLLTTIATPPPPIRAFLVAVSVLAAIWCLAEAVRRMEASRDAPPGALESRDLAQLIRGVRFVFLAVAAFAAASD